jgi:PAS domain-containing protein
MRKTRGRASRVRSRVASRVAATASLALAVAAARRAPFEHLARLDDGGPRPRWVLIAGNPRGTDDDGRWSGLIQDVTARQRLAASEREAARLRMSGLLGAAGGVAFWGYVGLPATNAFMQFLFGGPRIYPSINAAHLGEALLLILAFALVSTLYPARLAARISPREAMASDG